MMKNDWLDNETQSLKSELNSRESNLVFYKLFVMLIFLLFLSINAFGETITLNHYTAGFFPNTWRCPNPSCRYENYDGISHCALCGTKRK